MTFYIFLSLSSFLISLLGTRLVILALRKRNVLVDRPNFRSNHKVPTPRGGGIAVVFAMVIGMMIADVDYGIVLSIFLLAAISLMDDMAGMPVLARLLVQIVAVTIPLCMLDAPVFGGMLPAWLDKFAAGFLWVWFINLFNFMDGIDGISATEMICIGLGLSLIAAFVGTFPDNLSVFSIIVAAAGCGFIWWNWHPAKIFLGDVGSVPIGFVLGYLLLLGMLSGYYAAALILPAYYLSDGSITIAYRLLRGRKIWVAHSEHYYQKAVRNGRKHSTVARYIFGVNLLLILLATLSVLDPDLAVLHVGIAYMCVFMMLGFFAHERHNPQHEPF